MTHALENEQTFRQIVAQAHDLGQYGDIADVEELFASLQSQLASNQAINQNADVQSAYQQVLRYLQLAALPTQPEQAVLAIFQQHLLEAISTDIDIKTKLELLFLLQQDAPQGFPLRRKLLRAISENDEELGTRALTIVEAPGPLPPSIRNWILDFLRSSAAGGQLSSLEVATYLNTNKNAQALTDEERHALEQALSLYTYIVNPPIATVARQSSRAARPATARPSGDFRSLLLQSLFDEASLDDAVYEEEKALMTGGFDSLRIKASLKDALATGQAAKLQAAFTLLARSGELKELLGADSDVQVRVEQTVLPELLPKLKAQRSNVELRTLIEDFRRQPNRPVYLKSFLEQSLTSALRGNTDASARVGVRLVSILLRQKYPAAADMAYFDESAGQYRWATVGLDSQGVPVLQ